VSGGCGGRGGGRGGREEWRGGWGGTLLLSVSCVQVKRIEMLLVLLGGEVARGGREGERGEWVGPKQMKSVGRWEIWVSE